MIHIDLFSGFGGFAYAMRYPEPLGETVLFCENEPSCHEVLAHHWPNVPICGDIRSLTGDNIRRQIAAHVADAEQQGLQGRTGKGLPGKKRAPIEPARSVIVTAGFPCQDISHAGRRAGITGERSGLWSELCRVLGELRPDVALLENVAGLLSGRDVVDGASGPVELSWLGTVLGDLAEIGYDAEWHCIPAAAVGAPHRRDRWWCVAYPQHPDADRSGPHQPQIDQQRDAEFQDEQVGEPGSVGGISRLAHPLRERGRSRNAEREDAEDAGKRPGAEGEWRGRTEPHLGLLAHGLSDGLARLPRWPDDPHPDIPRVAQGVARRKHKLMGLGNAIVPQVARVILETALEGI